MENNKSDEQMDNELFDAHMEFFAQDLGLEDSGKPLSELEDRFNKVTEEWEKHYENKKKK